MDTINLTEVIAQGTDLVHADEFARRLHEEAVARMTAALDTTRPIEERKADATMALDLALLGFRAEATARRRARTVEERRQQGDPTHTTGIVIGGAR